MSDKRPAPSREELNEALDWIKDHKRRSVSHTVILMIMSLMTFPAAITLFTWLGLSAAVANALALGYLGFVSAALLLF